MLSSIVPDIEEPLARFGIMHQMWALSDERDERFLSETIEDVRLADSLGYDSIWLAEHHYVRNDSFYSRLPDPELLIARLISETKRIRLATHQDHLSGRSSTFGRAAEAA